MLHAASPLCGHIMFLFYYACTRYLHSVGLPQTSPTKLTQLDNTPPNNRRSFMILNRVSKVLDKDSDIEDKANKYWKKLATYLKKHPER